jgi:hypothetical protein
MIEHGEKYKYYLNNLNNLERTIQILELLDIEAYNGFISAFQKIRAMLEEKFREDDQYGLQNGEKELINLVAKFESDLNIYFSTHPEIDDKIKTKEMQVILYKSDEVIGYIEEGYESEKIEKAIEMLKNAWSSVAKKHNPIEMDTINKKFAEIMVRLQVEKCKREEQIDLGSIEKLCDRESFILKLKELMKKIVQDPSINEARRKTIEMFIFTCKDDEQLINNIELWKALSGKTDINIQIIVGDENRLALNKPKDSKRPEKRNSLINRITNKFTSRKMPHDTPGVTYKYCEYYGESKKFKITEDSALPWERKRFKKAYTQYGCEGKYCYSVTLPEGIEYLPEAAFAAIGKESGEKKKGYFMLKEVVLPDTLTKISDEAFRYCSSLKAIDIPINVTEIGRYAFFGCLALKSITIPRNVKRIGDCAFSECTSVTDLIIKGRMTEIGEQKFSTTGIKKIIVPKGTKQFYRRMLERTNTEKHIPEIFEEQEINAGTSNAQVSQASKVLKTELKTGSKGEEAER